MANDVGKVFRRYGPYYFSFDTRERKPAIVARRVIIEDVVVTDMDKPMTLFDKDRPECVDLIKFLIANK